MAVKTRRKNGGGMMGFRFMDTGSLPTLIGPASLFEGHVTQTAEDLNSRFMYWRTPKNSTAPCKWYVSLCVCVLHITYVCVFFSMEIKKVMQNKFQSRSICVSVMIWLQASSIVKEHDNKL
jgi:hypothetical protein